VFHAPVSHRHGDAYSRHGSPLLIMEVYPGFAAEWWFVPVRAVSFDDLRCGIRNSDGRTHTEHGMRGRVIIE
jgi:hypothetical protein